MKPKSMQEAVEQKQYPPSETTWDFLNVKTPLLAKMIIYLAVEPCWSCFEFNILHNGAPCKKIVFNLSCLLDKVKRLNTSTWITVRERF